MDFWAGDPTQFINEAIWAFLPMQLYSRLARFPCVISLSLSLWTSSVLSAHLGLLALQILHLLCPGPASHGLYAFQPSQLIWATSFFPVAVFLSMVYVPVLWMGVETLGTDPLTLKPVPAQLPWDFQVWTSGYIFVLCSTNHPCEFYNVLGWVIVKETTNKFWNLLSMLCSGLRKSDFENRGILGFNEYDFGGSRVFNIEILTKIWSVD